MTEILALCAKILLVVTSLMGVVNVHETRITALENNHVAQSQSFGAVSGPGTSDACFSFNGVVQCDYRQPIRQATTTICSIKTPNATTTLEYGAVNVTTSSSSATFIEMAQAATYQATTTLIGGKTIIGANARITLLASTSPTTGGTATIIGPNQFFVVKMQGGVTGGDSVTTGTGFVPTGSCQIRLMSI